MLDITPDGVKWHISELLAETGLADRQALAHWWVEEREQRRQSAWFPAWLARARLVGLAVAVSVVTAVVALVALASGTGDRGEDPPAPQSFAAEVAPSPTPTPLPAVDAGPPPPCDTPLPGGFRAVTAQELRAQGLVEFGRIIEPRSCPLQVANRASLSFFWLADGGEIDLEAAGLHIVNAFGTYLGSNYPPSDLGFYYDGEQFLASMFFVSTSSDAIEMVIEDADRIRFDRVGGEGAFASVSLRGEESGRHHVAFASDGTLFFDPDPLPGGLATNSPTGEAIDVSGMTLLGRLEFVHIGIPVEASTRCSTRTGICSAGLGAVSPHIRLPVGGVLTCVPVMSAGIEREGYELDTGEYVLRFSPVGGYGIPWNGGCATVSAWRDSLTHSISAGDGIYIWTYNSIAAFRPDGSPISLVVTRDGHLYIGDVTLDLGCPCRSGN